MHPWKVIRMTPMGIPRGNEISDSFSPASHRLGSASLSFHVCSSLGPLHSVLPRPSRSFSYLSNHGLPDLQTTTGFSQTETILLPKIAAEVRKSLLSESLWSKTWYWEIRPEVSGDELYLLLFFIIKLFYCACQLSKAHKWHCRK